MDSNDPLRAANRANEQVFSREQLIASGVPNSTIYTRCRAGGPWQRPLPRVVVTHSGPLTDRQRHRVALAYGLDGALLTGLVALGYYQVRAALASPPPCVDILVSQERRLVNRSFVRVHRARSLPAAVRVNGLPLVPPARAAADALRSLRSPDRVRGLLHELVQVGRCTLNELNAELRGQLGRPEVAQTLAELSGGARSVAEGRAQRLIAGADLPWPLWNAALYLDGVHLATPDAYWPAHGVVLEIDSRAHHLAVADWERTLSRHNRLEAVGLRVFHVSPRQLDREGGELVSAIGAALAEGPHGPIGQIVIRLA